MNIVFGGLSVIIVIYSAFFIVYKLFEKSGISFSKIKTNSINNTYLPSSKECFRVFGIALLIRIIIILMSIVIYSIFVHREGPINIIGALNNWIKWDASHYITISNGYASFAETGRYVTLVFFPLYPIFIKILGLLVSKVIAGLIISNLFFALACVFIYRLVNIDYGNNTAKKTLLLINVLPFSFFFSAIMSESTFMLFSAMTLYYIRKHKWFLVGIFGCLCALSRSLGVFIIFPALVELIDEYELIKNIKKIKYVINIILTKALPLILIPLGLGIYLYCNYRITGDWFYFLKMQKEIWFQTYNHFFLFFRINFQTLKSFDSNFVLCVTIPQLISVITAYIVLLFNVKKSRALYSAWLLINIVVNTSMSWPLSVTRYLLCAIPLYIFIADNLKKHQRLYQFFIILNAILLGIYFTAYLMNLQIY